MKTKMLVLGAFIAGILSAFFGGKAFATAGNTAEISNGTWEICINATLDSQSPDFSLDITKSGFKSQLVLGGGECKTVKLTGSSAYTVSLGSTMGASSVNYEVSGSSLTFNVADSLNNYLNAFGSVTYTTEGSGEESDFELLFSMPGTCYLNGNANVSGDTCKDGDGNPLTDKKYIDTGVALFSEGNAARDFEIYFTLDDYASTQPNNQGTLFNAKYENSSMLYPGFTLRMSGSNVQTMELTGRIGNDNTDADKAKKEIRTASLKGKEMKIVRVGGLVSYSIDGGELIEFQNYQNFSRYFEQNAVFGASLQPNGTPQRYYDGTVSNIRIYLKKVGSIEFNANGGTGTMSAIENKMIGTDVVLPANTFTKNRATFTGWNTEADGSGADYADEATVTISSEDMLTLYAQWEDIQVGSIEFNANGGTGTMTTIEDIPVGTNTTLPANTFTRTDYLFDGWNTESDGSGTGYADEATVTIASEDTLTLYAQWLVEPKGSIEFNANGGTGTMAAIENITLGTNVTLPANSFTRTGFNFNGWNTEADGSGTAYVDKATTTISSEGMITLYAQWEDTRVGSIEFNANGGTGTMAAIENVPLGTNVTLPVNVFKKTGFNFDGWNTEADGSGVAYDNGATVPISSEGVLTLYAQWGDPKGRIVFRGNGGAGTMAAIENIVPGTDVTLPANAFSIKNGTFSGWNTEADGSGVDYADEATVTVSSASTLALYAQWDGEITETKLQIGQYVNEKIKSLPVGATVRYSTADTQIKNLAFVDTLPSTVDENTPKVNIALDGEIPVYAYWVTSEKTIYINTEASKIYANENSAYMFMYMKGITSLTLPASFNTSKVTGMGNMFYGMEALTSLTLSDSFDTSNVTGMTQMFYGTALTSLTLPDSFNTSQATYMKGMFQNMTALTSLTLPDSFDTSNVTNMEQMFSGMYALSSLTLPDSFDTSNVTNMFHMFSGAKSLTSLTLPDSFDTSNVTNMNGMFRDTLILTSLTLPDSFDTSNVTSMKQMFVNMKALTSLTFLNRFDTSKVTDMSFMFSGMESLTSLSIPASWDTSKVTNMSYMFSHMPALTSLTLPDSFNTSNVTNMSYMFAMSAKSLTSFTLPAYFNTSKVTNMSCMFYGMRSVASLAFPSGFDTSNVTDMKKMFYEMYALTSLNLPSSFNTSNVTNMSYMFYETRALTSLSFSSNFDTSNVTDMSYMFSGARSLSSLTLPATFNTSQVTDMNNMFSFMTLLTSLTFSSTFDTSQVTNMSNMFGYVSSLTSLTLPDSFDTSNVTNMEQMFLGMYALSSLTLPNNFTISNNIVTNDIFKSIKNTAKLYAADATARSLWPGVLGN